MPDWLNAIILGLIEGITEFIPVSSTGHLLLAERAMGLDGPAWDTFAVLIQLGAILALAALYFQKLWGVVLRIPSDPHARHFAISIMIAFAPAVVLGLALHDIIKLVLFESPRLICWSLIIGGIALAAIERFSPPPRQFDAMAFKPATSLGVGLFQVLAMIPGVSRSGATIVGAMVLGADRRSAAEFSFFLAIPTMTAAFSLDLYKAKDTLSWDQGGLIAIGFVTAFVSGWFVVKTLLAFVTRYGFLPFAAWRIVVGAGGLIALGMVGH